MCVVAGHCSPACSNALGVLRKRGARQGFRVVLGLCRHCPEARGQERGEALRQEGIREKVQRERGIKEKVLRQEGIREEV